MEDWFPEPTTPTPLPAVGAPDGDPHQRRPWVLPAALLGGCAMVAAAVVAVAQVQAEPVADPPRREVVPAAASPAVPPPPSAAAARWSPVLLAAAGLVEAGVAQERLAGLVVRGRGPRTGYARTEFGQRWADVDRNGCDARNDVLRRDLQEVVLDPATRGCAVARGSLNDPYTGLQVPYVRGAGSDVEVDHVVALSDAWQKGAAAWDAQQRERFANDPDNLLAVSGGVNASKGDSDAATWLPPARGVRCAYVAAQVAVKARYGLSVTPAEGEAVARVLSGC